MSFFGCKKCGFSTDWDFSLARHLKNGHRIFREQDFRCTQAFVEKFLCQDWDCGTHMKVDFDIHMRLGYDWDDPKFIHEIQEEFRLDPWKCPECDFKTFSYLVSIAHNCKQDVLSTIDVEANNKSKWFYCGHCSYKSLEKKCLKGHIINKHLKRHVVKHKSSVERKSEQCSYRTKDKRETKWFNCEHCDYKAKMYQNLERHIKSKHSLLDDSDFFPCANCDYKTIQKGHLKRHMNVKHTSDDKTKWFECDQCTYKSKYPSALRQHVKLRHGRPKDAKWFNCEHCDYKANMYQNLERHIKSKHSSLDASDFFHCAHCVYRTIQKVNLKRHMNVKHTSDDRAKWFECDQCTYKSKHASALGQHVKYRHVRPEDVKWFYCGHCDHKAKQKSGLQRHIERNHLKIDN